MTDEAPSAEAPSAEAPSAEAPSAEALYSRGEGEDVDAISALTSTKGRAPFEAWLNTEERPHPAILAIVHAAGESGIPLLDLKMQIGLGLRLTRTIKTPFLTSYVKHFSVLCSSNQAFRCDLNENGIPTHVYALDGAGSTEGVTDSWQHAARFTNDDRGGPSSSRDTVGEAWEFLYSIGIQLETLQMMSTEELVELGLSPVAARLVLAEAKVLTEGVDYTDGNPLYEGGETPPLYDGYTDSEEEDADGLDQQIALSNEQMVGDLLRDDGLPQAASSSVGGGRGKGLNGGGGRGGRGGQQSQSAIKGTADDLRPSIQKNAAIEGTTAAVAAQALADELDGSKVHRQILDKLLSSDGANGITTSKLIAGTKLAHALGKKAKEVGLNALNPAAVIQRMPQIRRVGSLFFHESISANGELTSSREAGEVTSSSREAALKSQVSELTLRCAAAEASSNREAAAAEASSNREAALQVQVSELLQRCSDLQLRVSVLEESRLCTICMERRRNAVLMPCMHAMFCSQCLRGSNPPMQSCPTCRGPIAGLVECRLDMADEDEG
jgi:hypothetical protein